MHNDDAEPDDLTKAERAIWTASESFYVEAYEAGVRALDVDRTMTDKQLFSSMRSSLNWTVPNWKKGGSPTHDFLLSKAQLRAMLSNAAATAIGMAIKAGECSPDIAVKYDGESMGLVRVKPPSEPGVH